MRNGGNPRWIGALVTAAALSVMMAAPMLLAQPGTRRPRPASTSPVATASPTGSLIRHTGRETPLPGFPMSTALTPNGQYLLVLVAGEGRGSIAVFDAKTERQVSSLAVDGAWLGLALSPNGRLVYASTGARGTLEEFQLSPEGMLTPGRSFPVAEDAKVDQLIGDMAATPDGRMLYAADVLHDQVLVVNLSSGRVIERFPAGRRPYRIAFHPDGKTYFVTSWADATLTQYETLTGRRFNGIGVAAHPTDIAWRDKKTQLEEGEEASWVARMFVPAANTNTLYTIAVSSANDIRVTERTQIPLLVGQPSGMTPSAVALSPDQSRLYVACSDANALAVLDVSGVRTRLLGFIPTGEYPTAVRVLADGRVVVLNGAGSLVFLNPIPDEGLALQTGIALANAPLKGTDGRQRPVALNPIPFTPGEPTPVQYVVYILKEGRRRADVGERLTPNQFKLAREFTELPDFATPARTPLEGYYWSTAAIVPDYVRKVAAGQRDGKPELSELDLAAQPAAGYLWNQTTARLYGLTQTTRTPRGPLVVAPDSNADFKAPDRAVADTTRAQVYLAELAGFEQGNNMPRLTMLRLAGDRPTGPNVAAKDAAAIADSDYALGLIVERLTHSKFWPKMAIFIVGTHGADQRADAFVVSPFATRRPFPGNYTTLSVLRAMEHILGLAPMTIFDAGARTLDDAFQSTPDLRPYDPERPRVQTQ